MSGIVQTWQLVIELVVLSGMIGSLVGAFVLYRSSLISEKVTLRIGLGRFPDSLILLYAAKRKFLSPVNVQISFLHWRGAYNKLVDQSIDVIFGLTTTTASWKTEKHNLSEGYHVLSLYKGFSILLAPNTELLSLEEVRSVSPTSETQLQQTLDQLRRQKIYVMSSDTAASVKNLLKFCHLDNAITVEIVSNLEDEFSLFLQGRSAATGFVGGLTQRLIARRLGCKELVSEQSLPLGSVETTQLVSHRALADTMAMIEVAWFRAVLELKSSHEARLQFVNLMNEYCLPKRSQIRFDVSDFNLFWDLWERFASTADEALELAIEAERLTSESPVMRTPSTQEGIDARRGVLLTIATQRRE